MKAYAKLLGPPWIKMGEKSFEPPPGKTSAILYYLAYKGEWVTRDELVYLFWPTSDEGTARKNLRQLLTTIRRLPYTQDLEIEDARLRWRIANDVFAFKKALDETDRIPSTKLYSGDLLQGYKLPELPEFEDWLEFERQELRGRHREGVLSLARELEASDRHTQAAEVLEACRKYDPLDEEVLRRLLQALHKSGNHDEALEAFKRFQKTLERDLGGEPEESTLRLITDIKASAAGGAAAPAPRRHNLPTPLTPLLGREVEKTSLIECLFDPSCRLLTLTGPGGIGKTRLSIEVASTLVERETSRDGVWFISLATITTPELFVTTIAEALKFSFYGLADPKEQLFEYLRDKEMQLVLDNFEQLLAAAPLVAELLETCTRIKVLVTSREALKVRGEREFKVSPLMLPNLKQLPPFEQLSQYAAVDLFIQRAGAVKSNFSVTNENGPAVAEICHRLDGLPLAIELAAARTKLFSPQAMLARLVSVTGGPLKLLADGARDLPERQQTLRKTIAWSYNLLEPQEQTLFAQLSVFVGGHTLEATEAICNLADGLDVFSGLASLIDKSLLQQQEVSGESRFLMLATIQEYAAEKLEASDEAKSLKRSHAKFFLALAEEADPQLTGPEQTTWLTRLEAEYDNFRAALGWTLQRNEAEIGLRLAGALRLFWIVRGPLNEGLNWSVKALEIATEKTEVRAKVLLGASSLARQKGDYLLARSLLEESLTIYQELGDKRGIANAVNNLGIVALYQRDYASARLLYEQSLALARELGDKRQIARSLNNLGGLAEEQGNYVLARSLFEQGLAIARGIEDTFTIAGFLANLGTVACLQKDYSSARPFLEESLTLLREVGDKEFISYALEVFAALEAAEGEPERAARLYGGAEASREIIGAPLEPHDRPRYEREVASARAQLDEPIFMAAWTAGRKMTLEQAVAYALKIELPQQ